MKSSKKTYNISEEARLRRLEGTRRSHTVVLLRYGLEHYRKNSVLGGKKRWQQMKEEERKKMSKAKRLNSKAKGASFETQVVSFIRETFSASKGQCFRTPVSGGHPFAAKSDITLAPELRLRFPFCVECKFYRDWSPAEMFAPRAQEKKWIAQVLKSAKAEKSIPMLALKTNNKPPFVMVPENELLTFFDCGPESFESYLSVKIDSLRWAMVLMEEFFKMFKKKRKGTK